jgi:hypothetical protein
MRLRGGMAITCILGPHLKGCSRCSCLRGFQPAAVAFDCFKSVPFYGSKPFYSRLMEAATLRPGDSGTSRSLA